MFTLISALRWDTPIVFLFKWPCVSGSSSVWGCYWVRALSHVHVGQLSKLHVCHPVCAWKQSDWWQEPGIFYYPRKSCCRIPAPHFLMLKNFIYRYTRNTLWTRLRDCLSVEHPVVLCSDILLIDSPHSLLVSLAIYSFKPLILWHFSFLFCPL